MDLNEEGLKKDQEDTLVDVSLDEVCPICLEGKELFVLSCQHQLHLECVKQMNDSRCPICRKSFEEDVSEDILALINENNRKYHEDLDAEDRQRLASEQFNLERLFAIYIRPRPFIEARYALAYLRNQGIPLNYLPQRVQIKCPRGHPKPEPGVIFSTLVGQAVERMEADLSDDDSDESSSDSETDPFEDENRMLERLSRVTENIQVDPRTYAPLLRQ